MYFGDRNPIKNERILVSNSNRMKIIFYRTFWTVQSRLLNNSPIVLEDFRFLESTYILGIGSKNLLWNRAWARHDFWMDLGSKFGLIMNRNWSPKPLEIEVGDDIVSRTNLGRWLGSLSRSDYTQNDNPEGGYEGTKGGSNIVTRFSRPISWGTRMYVHIYIYI